MKKWLALVALSTTLAVSPVTASSQIPTISQQRLNQWTKKWQHILQLNDWSVRTVMVRLVDLPEGTLGASRHSHEGRRMIIYVLDPRDYKEAARRNDTPVLKGKAITEDIEDTIVHELLHVRIDELSDATQENREAIEEMVVVRLTKALLGK